MGVVTFDTLKFVEKLRSHGFEEQQAKGIAEAIRDVQATSLETLATKGDIHELKRDLQALELKVENKLIRVESELTLVKWMLGILIAGVLSLVLKAFF